MGWFRTVDCECPEPCGPDPCTSPCIPCYVFAGYNPLGGDDTFDVTGMFLKEHGIAVDRVGDCSCYPVPGGSGVLPESWRIRIYADGAVILDTGCTSGNFSSVIPVPEGTNSLRFLIEDQCAFECESGFSGDCEVYFTCV